MRKYICGDKVHSKYVRVIMKLLLQARKTNKSDKEAADATINAHE